MAARNGVITDPRAWLSGKAPTRDETLAELARILRRCRESFPRLIEAGTLKQADADVRIDRVQAAHDLVAGLPREGAA